MHSSLWTTTLCAHLLQLKYCSIRLFYSIETRITRTTTKAAGLCRAHLCILRISQCIKPKLSTLFNSATKCQKMETISKCKVKHHVWKLLQLCECHINPQTPQGTWIIPASSTSQVADLNREAHLKQLLHFIF